MPEQIDSTQLQLNYLNSNLLPSPLDLVNYTLTATVLSNAMTITLLTSNGSVPSSNSPVITSFRNSPITAGTYSRVNVTGALSLVIPNGATLGTFGGVSAGDSIRECVYVYLINNAGVAELAVSGGIIQNEDNLINTISIGVSSDSLAAFYSNSARTGVACRLIGTIYFNQNVAGVWAAAPKNISIQPNRGRVSLWRQYVASITATVSNPTKSLGALDLAFWRQTGDSIEVMYSYKQTSAGTTGSGLYQFNLPSDLLIDGDKGFLNYASFIDGIVGNVGTFSAYNGTTIFDGWCSYSTSGGFLYTSGISAVRGADGFPFLSVTSVNGPTLGTTNVDYSLNYKVPVAQFA